MIAICRQFEFEAAHFLTGYDGPCKNIHGHSYKLEITVTREINKGETNPLKDGMIIDFKELKSLVLKHLINDLDHSLLIGGDISPDLLVSLKAEKLKVMQFDFSPTAENIINFMAEKLVTVLPKDIKLVSIKLNETSGCSVKWLAGNDFMET